jgi:hypothetical protein
MADPYGNRIGEEQVVRFTTRPLDPAIYLQVPGNVGLYNAYTSTYVYISHLNVTQADITLSRLTWDEFQRLTHGRLVVGLGAVPSGGGKHRPEVDGAVGGAAERCPLQAN